MKRTVLDWLIKNKSKIYSVIWVLVGLAGGNADRIVGTDLSEIKKEEPTKTEIENPIENKIYIN